jgi:hypothetical protein
MAPIGPGFTAGAIFAFENNTPVRGCGWPWRGWRQHSMRPAQSRRAHVKRRRAQLLNARAVVAVRVQIRARRALRPRGGAKRWRGWASYRGAMDGPGPCCHLRLRHNEIGFVSS